MKTYNSTNFFKHTYCEFKQVATTFFTEHKESFKSKSGSLYFYTDVGVYRYSNHWGRVANCRWKLVKAAQYKNQQYCVGFANWADFYSLTSPEKKYSLSVDFSSQQVDILPVKEKKDKFLFSLADVLKRQKEIQNTFKNPSWLKYCSGDKEQLLQQIVHQLISTNKTLQQIKLECK